MDNVQTVSEDISDVRNVQDFRPREFRRISPEDLHVLTLKSAEDVQELIERYNKLNVPKEDVRLFAVHLLHRSDAWFVETADVGIIYLTSIRPRFDATLNIMFWDGKLSNDRREAVKTVLATAFDLFELRRVNAVTTVTNLPLRRLLSKIGFALEGVVRRGSLVDGEYIDTWMFGMLKDELPPCIKMDV